VIHDLQLELTDSTAKTWAAYKDIRSRHYVPDKGSVGRQLHYVVRYQGSIIGICAGGMSTQSSKERDTFFGLDWAQQFDEYFADEHEGQEPLHTLWRNKGIIQNTVFRNEYVSQTNDERNLSPAIVALWRKHVVQDWYTKFPGDQPFSDTGLDPMPVGVLGFETFVVPNDHRSGKCYIADNWKPCGVTATGKIRLCKWNEDFRKSLLSYLNGKECLLNHYTAELLEAMCEAGA
jgi:hypothetical protein